MKIHIHDNTALAQDENNCMSETELTPGEVLTLHMHEGDCRLCGAGHCHDKTINMLIVDGALYVVFENGKRPELITQAAIRAHRSPTH